MKRPSKHTKRKASARKETPQAIRRRYTWHLRPPFDAEFDRSHWWKGQAKPDRIAALYELARRHPLVHDGWLKKIEQPGSGSLPPPSLYWTCLLGRKSWATLDYDERKNWESCVGCLKGLDFRAQDMQCRCIRVLAHWKIQDKRADALRDKAKTFENLSKLVRADLAKKLLTADEWEAAIAERAVEAYRQGYVLLAVAFDLAADKAKSVMALKYSEHLELYPPLHRNQRARWESWLPIIAEFEEDQASGAKAKAQVFARYRRALDAVSFA